MLLLNWKVIHTGKIFRKNEFSGTTCIHETFVLESFIFENERKTCFLQEFFSWIPPKFIFHENTIQQMTSPKQTFNEKLWFHIKHKSFQTFLVSDLHNFIHEYQCLQLILLLKCEWKCEHSSPSDQLIDSRKLAMKTSTTMACREKYRTIYGG